jgi:hypothetical protein
MRAIRTVLVGAAAACALCAPAATASAQAPEYGRCVQHAGGKFTTSKCTTEAAGSGSWEWEPGPGPKAHFSAALNGTSTFRWLFQNGGFGGKCTGVSLSGEYTGPKTVGAVHLAFTGCSYTGNCGTIAIAPLVGELGVYALGETAEKNKLGLKLRPETGTSYAEFSCSSGSFGPELWRGGFVIGQAKSNVMALTSSLNFQQHHARAVEEQVPSNFLGEPPSPLEATGDFEIEHSKYFVEIGWAMALSVHGEERIEANSVA